jgi:Skp family chaperone for outer membrane proteins
MKQTSVATAIFAISAFLASHANAETRIATVDMTRLVNESPEADAKKKDLDKTSEELKKKVETEAKKLQALKEKLETAKVSPDSKEAESFRVQARDFERLRADAKADLEKKYVKINQELTGKVYARIEAYAKDHKYDLIVDKNEKIRGPIVFSAQSKDITDEVLKSLK